MNAPWITSPDYDGKKNFYFEVKKEFSLEKLPESAVISITADSRYELFVNGFPVLSGPVRGSRTLHFYDKKELLPWLKTGANELLARVFSMGEKTFTCYSTTAGVSAEIKGLLSTDESWEARVLPQWHREPDVYTFQIGSMEWRDDRKEPGPWKKAKLLPEPVGKTLLENTLPPQKITEYLPADIPVCTQVASVSTEEPLKLASILQNEPMSPLPEKLVSSMNSLCAGKSVTIPSMTGVRMILDFDREISGRFEAEIEAPEGTVAELTYGEESVDSRMLSLFPRGQRYHFTDRYILKSGISRIGTRFSERGFRMVQLILRNFSTSVTIKSVKAVDQRYPVVQRGSFFCSDHRLNRIWQVCQETLSACMSDVFMDCPWRERGFWVNDLLVNNIANLTVFGTMEIHRHCLQMAFSQHAPDGLLPAICPCPAETPEEHWMVFAPTNCYMMLILRDYLDFSGDTETVRGLLPDMEKILNILWSLADEKGILQVSGYSAKWHFYDWSFELNGYNLNGQKESMLNSLFILAVKEFLRTAGELGFHTEKELWQKRYKKTAEHLPEDFFDLKKGKLVDSTLLEDNTQGKISTQLAHALWLLTNEVPTRHRKQVEKALIDPGNLMPEYYLHYFWFRAAELTGDISEGLNRIRKYWGRCIDTGSPTLYEAGIHKFGLDAMKGSGSLCHGFGTIPVNFFHRSILGVKPLETGFRKFLFAPDLMDLDFARGRIPVPGGTIKVELQKGKPTVLTVPAGCTAVLKNGKELGRGTHQLAQQE